ncbi:MAG: DUF4412 domain-containing protein [Prosthecochloris sp.]|nr:DUF4412 domain-containing protein [Prosthecochloris sp.]
MRRITPILMILLVQFSLLAGCGKNGTTPADQVSGSQGKGLSGKGFEGILDMKITSKEGSQEARMMLAQEGTRFEMAVKDPQSGSIIMDLVTIAPSDEPDMIYTLNRQQKTYSVIDLAQLQEDLEPLAEEPGDNKFEVKQLGTETILGYRCNHVSLTDENGTTELWLTKDLLSASDITRLQMGNDHQKEVFDARMKHAGLEGFPLKTLDRESGTAMEFTNIERTSLDRDLFSVPSDYTRKESVAGAMMPEISEEEMKQIEEMQNMMDEENMQDMEEMMKNMQKQLEGMQIQGR